MPAPNDIHRIAILLKGLGADTIEPALSGLGNETLALVRQELNALSQRPPSDNELYEVLGEFETFLRFALSNAKANGTPGANGNAGHNNEADSARQASRKPSLKLFSPSDDPLEDLMRVTPRQIALALSEEHPATVCLITSCLPADVSAAIIDQLPPDLQAQTFLALRKPLDVPRQLVEQVVRKTVEKASRIEPEVAESRDDIQKIADLLRAMPKPTRNRLFAELERDDPELAERLRGQLYLFEDIVRYDNRSIQRLLGRCDTQELVVALQGAEEKISNRLFENLSKRAASAVREEMEFKQSSTEEEITAARNSIATLIAELDRAGEMKELA